MWYKRLYFLEDLSLALERVERAGLEVDDGDGELGGAGEAELDSRAEREERLVRPLRVARPLLLLPFVWPLLLPLVPFAAAAAAAAAAATASVSMATLVQSFLATGSGERMGGLWGRFRLFLL